MKRTRVKRYVGLDARSAAELGELLTAKCEQLKEWQPQVEVDLSTRSALLFYEERLEEPEDIRDEYELRGETYTCGECPFKEPVTDGRCHHRWKCRRMPRGTDDEQRACLWFYQELEEGRVYK